MRKTKKEYLIQMLEDGIQVTYSAPGREDYGYPYAVGYSQSVMKNVLEMLREEKVDE